VNCDSIKSVFNELNSLVESSATEQHGGATLQTLGKVHPSENPKDCGNSNLHLRLLSENVC
jgi:hypothetical protein